MTSSNPEEMQPMEGGEGLQPHRGPLILILGILGIFPLGLLAGLPALLLGKGDLAKMDQGVMDSAGRKATKIGRTLGIISIAWSALWVVAMVLGAGTLFAGFLGARNEAASADITQRSTSIPGRMPTAGQQAAARVAQLTPSAATAPSTVPVPAATASANANGMPIGPGDTYGGLKEPNRADPFVHQWAPPQPAPKPPTPILPAFYNVLGGLRVQTSASSAPALRRTSGLVWNDNVYGLLEIGGETYIVRPGDKIENYLVSAITRDSIVLYSAEQDKYFQIPLQASSAQRPEAQGGTLATGVDNLPAQIGATAEKEAVPEALTPFDEFTPALPPGNYGY